MNKTILAALGVALCAGAATPALADYDRIGSVSVDAFGGREARSIDLGGSVTAFQFRADGNDIDCTKVTASFGNGNTRQIFSGRLYRGRSMGVDLPGGLRSVTRLAFNCRALGGSSANLVVSADIGAYRDEWRRNPNWARVWSHIFNWGTAPAYGPPPPPPSAPRWSYMGQVNFQGRDDRDDVFNGWSGQKADRIALKTNAPLRCSRIYASFGNGVTRTINLRNSGYVMPGQYYELDLPGETRKVVNLSMRCRPAASFSATAQIFAVRD